MPARVPGAARRAGRPPILTGVSLLFPIVGALLGLAGLALITVAGLGARSRLPRNRFAGVRTAATLRDDETFVLANRVAAVPVGAAGAVGLVGGVAVLAARTGVLAGVVLTVAVVGLLALAGLGGVLGDRAAARAARTRTAPGCAGACTGCDLVAGCRDGAGAAPSSP